MVKQSAFASQSELKSRKRGSNKQPSVYEVIKWLFEEFGFATLLLAFSFGSLTVATAVTNLTAAREWASVATGMVDALESQCQVPTVPANVRARGGWDKTGEIVVSWLASSRVDHYAVAFGKQSGVYEYGSTNVGNERQYILRDLEPGKAYYLVVSAENECGSSGYSNEVMAVASGAITPKPTVTLAVEQTPEAEINEATPAGSMVGKKGEEKATPAISPYYGDLPAELEQSNLTEDELLTPEEQKIEIANLATNLFAKKGFQQLVMGLGLFAMAAILALLGLRHINKSGGSNQVDRVKVHKGKLTDLEEHEITIPMPTGGGKTMGFGK